ncbi:MAG: acyl-CoA dehydrogenase family protein [Microbacterium sp.]
MSSVEEEFRRLAERFRPLFAQIADGESERERGGIPPREQLQLLIDAGFAGLRVPRDLGGEGARLSTVLRLISELAVADVNLAHIWRNHVSFLEDRLAGRDDPRSDEWLRRLGRGEIIGGGWSEPGTGTPGISTHLVATEGGWLLSGVKYYTTGSIYADWATVLALEPDGTQVVALVNTSAPGVTIGDDWDGFGQRLTGSGSVTYENVHVPTENVFRYEARYVYQLQFYQSTLNALLVGIANALVRDGAAALRARGRSHPNALSPAPADDPELLEVLGRVSAHAWAAESAFLASLDALDADLESSDDDWSASRLATYRTQLVVTQNVLDAASAVFDALGSSGTSASFALDRHWRNARTIASHNPRVYVARIVGDAAVNGRLP